MSFKTLRRLLVSANATYVALESRAADMLAAMGTSIARGERVSDEALAAACGDDDLAEVKARAARMAGPTLVPTGKGQVTAIVSFKGLVTYDMEYQPFAVSTRMFAENMRQLAADPAVKSIVMFVDSPGGTVVGLPEAADAVWEARKVKPVTAIVDVLCASAAYYVASQATEIIALPSGVGVGSIGVRMMHIDCSAAMASGGMSVTHIYSGEYKVEGNSFAPLSEDARARYQLECDTLYMGFLAAVARGRGKTIAEVGETFGKGRVLMPFEARRVGMIDKLQEPAAALRKLGVISAAVDMSIVTAEAAALGDTDEPASDASEAPVTQDEKVNQELTTSPAVDVAAVADLSKRRRLLELASY